MSREIHYEFRSYLIDPAIADNTHVLMSENANSRLFNGRVLSRHWDVLCIGTPEKIHEMLERYGLHDGVKGGSVLLNNREVKLSTFLDRINRALKNAILDDRAWNPTVEYEPMSEIGGRIAQSGEPHVAIGANRRSELTDMTLWYDLFSSRPSELWHGWAKANLETRRRRTYYLPAWSEQEALDPYHRKAA